MTAIDILQRWLDEHHQFYQLLPIPDAETCDYNITIYKKKGVYVSCMWLMVGKDQLKIWVLMLESMVVPKRMRRKTYNLNMGDPEFFTKLENILRGVGTLAGPTVLKTVNHVHNVV